MPLFELSLIYRDFSGATAKKAFHIKHFRWIRSTLKLPSKIAKLPLTYKTRNQVVAQAARGFESHPVRQLCGFAGFANPHLLCWILPCFALNISISGYRTVYSPSRLSLKFCLNNRDENKYLLLSNSRYDRVSFESVSCWRRFSTLYLPQYAGNRRALNYEYCFSW